MKMKSSKPSHTMETQQQQKQAEQQKQEKKKQKQQEEQKQQSHDQEELTDATFHSNSDLCQQLMDRYAASSAAQHRHLVATAAAMRSIVVAESLPLTPTAYFAASISAISNSTKSLDSDAVTALTTLIAIALPLVPPNGIDRDKAIGAINILVELVEKNSGGFVSTASVKSVVKCLGVLVSFCDLENWSSVKFGLERLLMFSVDKRPKVRKCSQVCAEKIFKSFQSSTVIKEASKLVLSLLRSHMPVAVELISLRTEGGFKDEKLSTPDLEVLHMLNVLKLIVPFLSVKVSSRIFSELQKLIISHFTALTRLIFGIIEAYFEASEEAVFPELENTLVSLASFVSLGEKNPMDTVMSAATLLKSGFDKLHAREPTLAVKNLPLVITSVAGILNSEASSASQAAGILKELIHHYIDQQTLLTNQPLEDDVKGSIEASAIKATCAIFEDALCRSDGSPNEHLLAVISVLFLELGESSSIFMKGILFQLANLITLAGEDLSNTNHMRLKTCMGSAVIAMGPEKLLELLPISLPAEDFTCSNIWLIPLLKDYVVGASMGYYMEHIVPLAKLFQQASRKVKVSLIGQDLQAHAHGLWGLLPAFCRYPKDIYQNIVPLAKLLVTCIKKNSFMHGNIAVALEELVKQNRSVLCFKKDAGESNTFPVKHSISEFRDVTSYSKKTATRNIKALASCSTEVLQALTNLFLKSPPEKRLYLKDAIGCLASIADSSVSKNILMSLLGRFQLINDLGESQKLGNHTHAVDEEQDNSTTEEKVSQRCLIVELASSLVEGAEEDLIDLIYDFVRQTLQATEESNHQEAYHTLSRILEEHVWFCSSRLVELIDLLLNLNSPVDIASLRSRFASFHILMVHLVKGSLEEETTKAFLVLNEIILKLKDSKEEARKVAYDTLLMISSSLQSTPLLSVDAPYFKLINMITGYLSGSSPHIKSGAISALSVLVFKDVDICLSIPDLVLSILTLLQNKDAEVIKAALGFVKVLVSCLQAKDLQNILNDVVNGVLPWSAVSRNHFRSKVTVILEIVLRKCGSAAVKLNTPEKYKGFIKTILENRHGKTSSKEAGATDKELTSADSSTKGLQKSEQREDWSLTSQKRKREGKQTCMTNEPLKSTGNVDNVKRIKGAGRFNREKPGKGIPRGWGNNKRKEFNEHSPNDRDRKMKQAKMRKFDKAVHRPLNASKILKHKKVGRQRQRK